MFARRLIGDCMFAPALQSSHFALYDIDPVRLRESKTIIDVLNEGMNGGRAKVTAHLGVKNRRTALKGADYVINAVQVGGYESTLVDFEIPRKYGLKQTIGDTLGIGGIFRALRTIPVMLDFAQDIESVCPDALLLNYTNPMAMVTGALLHGTNVKCVGLCHSIQGCVRGLMLRLGMLDDVHEEVPLTHIATADTGHHIEWTIAGINHQAWLLSVTDNGKDLYPELKRRAFKLNRDALRTGAQKHDNMVRYEIMRHFGYYVTESSVHTAEYSPYWIKSQFPELVSDFNISIDEYLRRCESGLANWHKQYEQARSGKDQPKHRSHEYGSYIIESAETDVALRIHGNVLNNGLITNLPRRAIVEVPCLVDRNGVQPVVVGDLPEQCAALNRTNINVQLLAIQAALTLNRESIYHAAYLDPNTAAELPLDKIRQLCEDMIEGHGKMLPKYT